MRGAWGKPYGTVARVDIGQILLSVRCKESNAATAMEALRRARYKFPGRQKIIISKKWGFTNVNKEEYQRLKAEKRVLKCVRRLSLSSGSMLTRLLSDGAYVQYIRPRGPLEANLKAQLRA
jgi:large subunit ribosomal protein L10e